ncbi:hypothetical protein ACB092_12G130600 [Castanea dentata]
MTSQWQSAFEDGPADLTTKAPHFVKMSMPQSLREGKLLIPKKFIAKYGVDLSNMAFLMIPNGTTWKVKLTKRDGEVWFENGWCKFASCHGLTLGHLLVFRYEGNSHFYVLIFDATATEIDYPLDDQLQVRRLEDSESDDNSVKIIDGFMPSQKTREIDGGVGTSTSRRRLKGKAVVNDEEYKALENSQELMTTNGEAENLSLPHGIINYLPREGFTKDYTKGSILTIKLQVMDRLWLVKLYIYEGMNRTSSCVVSASWSAFVRENKLRVGDVCVFEVIMRAMLC